MLVKFVLLTRRADLSRKGFAAHWSGPHAALLAQLPEHRQLNTRYVQNHVVSEPGFLELGDVDGIAQTWPRDRGSLGIGFHESPHYDALVRPDVLRFVDTARTRVAYAEVRATEGDHRPFGAKALVFLRAAAGVAPDAVFDVWGQAQLAQLHAMSGARAEIRGLTQYRVLKTQRPGAATTDANDAWCHAVVEIRLNSLNALRRLLVDWPGASFVSAKGPWGEAEVPVVHAVREVPIYNEVDAEPAEPASSNHPPAASCVPGPSNTGTLT